MGQGMSEILPGLYLGNFRDSKDREQLKTNKITHILSIHDNAKPLLEGEGYEYLCITASDTPDQNINQYFEQAIDFVHNCRVKKKGSCLIHCLAGISRSTTLTVAYMMTVNTKYNWQDCLRAATIARTVARPNFGFQRQLQDYEHTTLPKMKEKMKKDHPEYSPDVDNSKIKELLDKYKSKKNNAEAREGQDDFLYPLPHNAYDIPTPGSGPVM